MFKRELSKIIFFLYNDEIYSYVKYEDFDSSLLPKIKKQTYKEGKYNRLKYVDAGCGFDIETTRISENKTIMYVWQFSIGPLTIIGRTWDEFREFLQILSEHYELDEKYKLLVYIHNMKYEWCFIKSQLKWNYRTWTDKMTGEVKGKYDIFAVDNRNIIKATTANFVEFRDSYILTQMGLGKMAESYDLGISKLKGDLDYNLKRHNRTRLTNQELAYCINDVQILSRFYHKYIKKQYINKRLNIPLTCTGIVRDELKREFKKLDSKTKNKFKAKIKKAMPTEDEYAILMEYVYRGGFVHANAARANTKFTADIMGSFDFKSSYPAVMLHEKYVWKYNLEEPEWFYLHGTDKRILQDMGYWGEFKIYDVKRKLNIPHTIESKDKIVDCSEDAIFDNGRLLSASWITVWLTEQDVLNYLDIYDVENPGQWECFELHLGKKEPLPQYLIDLVLKYFYLKETLEKDSLEYCIAKGKLNSFYGMCCTSIMFSELMFDDTDFMMHDSENGQSYENAIKKLILLPQWGIQISAYARRNLVKTFAKLGNDAIYGDTDSAKVLNLLNNEYIFKDYNDRIKRMNKTMYVGNYDRKYFARVGEFDFEGKILNFKTIGCKRYIFDEIHKDKETNKYSIKTTIKAAGVVKGTFQKYCDDNELDYYEAFDFGLSIDEEHSEKLVSTFNDTEPFMEELTDYQGESMIVSENTCITLNPTTASINMSETIRDYLILIVEENERFKRTGVRTTVWR